MKLFLFVIPVLFSIFKKRKVPLYFYLVYFLLCYIPSYPYDLLTCLLFCIFLEDFYEMYISFYWIIPVLFVGVCVLSFYWNISSSLIALLLYEIPILLIYTFRKDWIGKADVGFIFYFCILLGYKRMSICFLISCLTGIFYSVISKKREIPFLCFLSIGVYFSILCGFQMWDIFYNRF